jgi:hypothetical protein
MIGPKRINNPDVLVKYLSWFHACKDTKKSRAEQKIFNLFYAEREYLRDFYRKDTKKAESKKTFGSIFLSIYE